MSNFFSYFFCHLYVCCSLVICVVLKSYKLAKNRNDRVWMLSVFLRPPVSWFFFVGWGGEFNGGNELIGRPPACRICALLIGDFLNFCIGKFWWFGVRIRILSPGFNNFFYTRATNGILVPIHWRNQERTDPQNRLKLLQNLPLNYSSQINPRISCIDPFSTGANVKISGLPAKLRKNSQSVEISQSNSSKF